MTQKLLAYTKSLLGPLGNPTTSCGILSMHRRELETICLMYQKSVDNPRALKELNE